MGRVRCWVAVVGVWLVLGMVAPTKAQFMGGGFGQGFGGPMVVAPGFGGQMAVAPGFGGQGFVAPGFGGGFGGFGYGAYPYGGYSMYGPAVGFGASGYYGFNPYGRPFYTPPQTVNTMGGLMQTIRSSTGRANTWNWGW